jgi:hypothetical protein
MKNTIKFVSLAGLLAASTMTYAELVTYQIEGSISPTNAYLMGGLNVGDDVSMTIAYDSDVEIIPGGMNYYLELPKEEFIIDASFGEHKIQKSQMLMNPTITLEGHRTNYYQGESTRNINVHEIDSAGFIIGNGEVSLFFDKQGSNLEQGPITPLDITNSTVHGSARISGDFGNFTVDFNDVSKVIQNDADSYPDTGDFKLSIVEFPRHPGISQFDGSVSLTNLKSSYFPVTVKSYVQFPDGFITEFQTNQWRTELLLAPHATMEFPVNTFLQNQWPSGDYKLIFTAIHSSGLERIQEEITFTKQ